MLLIRRTIICVFILAVSFMSFTLATYAADAAATNLSHSYQADTDITSGSLVSLVSGKKDVVTDANAANGKDLVGVATLGSSSLLAVSKPGDTVQVALDGTVDVLVSTLGGSITAGDQVSVSPINGVGMKAEPNSRVIGVARESFNFDSSGSQSQDIKDKQGNSKQVKVGYISITIAIGTAPSGNDTENDRGGIPSGITKLADSIAGHRVSTAQIVLSGIVALVAMVALIVLIYGTIKGSFSSIGRNPLAKPAIFESIAQVMTMVALIVVLAVIIIYIVLR